jgi:hypothetical protein
VSRQREFLADASAVQYTRVVAGIGGALRKIADQAAQHADRLRAAQAGSLAHLMLSRPGRRAWWSSHPSLGERLRRLYGRDPGPLAADLLPAPDDAEPLVAFAPKAAGAGLATHEPEAHRHDALQNPALYGDAEREREALERIGRWHGRGERFAALLALVLVPRDDAGWAAWSSATAHLPVAAAVRAEVQALRPSARQQVLELLARRTSMAPRAERLALLHAAGRLALDPLPRLRLLALRHLLARPRRTAGRQPLAALADDALAASTLVAPLLGGRDGGVWWSRLLASVPGQPRRLHRVNERVALHAVLRLQRRLAPMQRPLLWRAWLDASAQPLNPTQQETLALAAVLLDLPRPD